MSDVIYRAAPDPNAHLHPKLTNAEKQQEFMQFVQRPLRSFETKDNLDVAVDLLVIATHQPNDWTKSACACQAHIAQTASILKFLHRQGLLTAHWTNYYARADAVDELLYRLEHEGRPSWPEPITSPVVDPHAEARRAAKHKLKDALTSAGYRANGSARLRVVG